jgi:thiol-disulfide isomerase/thioredoxin
MHRALKWTLMIVGSLAGAIAVPIFFLWTSIDLRYRTAYFVAAHFDVNAAVTPAEAERHFHALKAAKLVDAKDRPFDWNAGGNAVIWVNQWAYWCAPCILEFADMKRLEERVGKNRLRIVLLSQPEYWERDKAKAKTLGVDFEMAVPQGTSVADMAAIRFGKVKNGRVVGWILPNSSFMRADGEGLAAFRSPKTWNSAEWETTIARWYSDGLPVGPVAANTFTMFELSDFRQLQLLP